MIEGGYTLDQAEARCTAKLSAEKIVYADINLQHGKCCDITDGNFIAQDPDNDNGTVCLSCSSVEEPCHICGAASANATGNKCYDHALAILQNQPSGCFDSSYLSHEQLETCKSRGVSFIKVEKINNTFEGVEIVINLSHVDGIGGEKLQSLLTEEALSNIFKVELKNPDNGTSIPFTKTVVFKAGHENVDGDSGQFLITVKPIDKVIFKLSIEPASFNLFSGLIETLTNQLSDPEYIGDCDPSNSFENCENQIPEGSSGQIPDDGDTSSDVPPPPTSSLLFRRRVLQSGFSNLSVGTIQSMISNFTPDQLTQISSIRVFKNFPDGIVIVPIFNTIDIPTISYPVLGAFIGYFLWLFQACLVYVSIRFYKKRVNLMK